MGREMSEAFTKVRKQRIVLKYEKSFRGLSRSMNTYTTGMSSEINWSGYIHAEKEYLSGLVSNAFNENISIQDLETYYLKGIPPVLGDFWGTIIAILLILGMI